MYNLKTSEIRAERLKEEILRLTDSINISSIEKRIIPKGYGESFLKEDCECIDCTEKQHQINDRIVIKIEHSPSSKSLKNRGGRGPAFEPISLVKGKITLQVCVDIEGNVIHSRTTLLPELSTIDDNKVIEQAIISASKWKFKPSSVEIACGTITYVIKIKEE